MYQQSQAKANVLDLSKHLFWDVDTSNLDFKKNEKLIVQRVLDYGILNDWLLIRDVYGIRKIAEIAAEIGELDKRSASFISLLSGVSKEKFICYTTRQSMNRHWTS